MAGSDGAYLTLGAASKLLGVDPDTLRRWADAGKIAVHRTAGGHRRFPAAAVEAMIPRRRARRALLTSLGEPRDRVAAELRRRVRTEIAAAASEPDWHARLDERGVAWFRERGHRMSVLLVGYLDATRRTGRDQLFAQAQAMGREYGVEAARRGLSIGEVTQAFLFFRARFMAEIASIARRQALDATQTSMLFEEADRALDGVIVALVEGHRSGRTRARS